MKLWEGDKFSDGYFATFLTNNWRQKYPHANQYPTRLVDQQIIWWTCKWLIRRGYCVLGKIPQQSKYGATPSYVLEPCFTWKLREAVIFVCKWQSGGVLLPEELATCKSGIAEETVDTALVKNIRTIRLIPIIFELLSVSNLIKHGRSYFTITSGQVYYRSERTSYCTIYTLVKFIIGPKGLVIAPFRFLRVPSQK